MDKSDELLKTVERLLENSRRIRESYENLQKETDELLDSSEPPTERKQ